MEGSSWEGQNFHSNSEVVVPYEGEEEEEDMPLGLLICSTVVSMSLFHVFMCRHISFSNFYAIFSAWYCCH